MGYSAEILVANLRNLSGIVDRYLTNTLPLAATGGAGRPDSRPPHAHAQAQAAPAPVTFLLFNYHSILTRLTANAWTQHSDEVAYWSRQLNNKSDEYVEDEMRDKFPALVAQVAKMEALNPAAPADAKSLAELRRFVELQADITYWRKGIEALHASITSNFAAPMDNGARAAAAGAAGAGGKAAAAAASSRPGSMGIGSSSGSNSGPGNALSDQLFQKSLSQLILYHKRLEIVVNGRLERGEARALVSTSTLQIEMKKFKH